MTTAPEVVRTAPAAARAAPGVAHSARPTAPDPAMALAVPSPDPVPAPANLAESLAVSIASAPALAAGADEPRTSQGPARATITPVWTKNPPVWATGAATVGDIPAELNTMLLPLPVGAATNVAMAVCVPFYSEEGFALRRGLEALALQRSDLRRFWAHTRRNSAGPSDVTSTLPELHVFAIADGWRKGDGSGYIVADSMFEELAAIFGESLNVDELVAMLEAGSGEAAAEEAQGSPPEGVLVQFAVGHGADATLAPVRLDVSWCQSMHSRATTPEGLASAAVERAKVERERERARGRMIQSKALAAAGSREGIAALSQVLLRDGSRAAAPLLLGSGADVAGTASDDAYVAAEDERAGEPEQPLFFTLFIKRENAKKHHSHRWFFEAFAPVTRLRSAGACKCESPPDRSGALRPPPSPSHLLPATPEPSPF
jgi:hypothetical protein